MASRPTIETPPEPPRAPSGRLRVGYEFNLYAPPKTRFAALVNDHEIAHTATEDWTTSARSTDELLPYAIATARSGRSERALLDLGSMFGAPCFALVTVSYGTVHVQVAAGELPTLAAVEEWLREVLPASRPAERIVPVSFWANGSCGAARRVRELEVPTWSDIEANYAERVRSRLRTLMTSYRPSASGQLLLWHGEPGTGKTYAIRALSWEWRDWCEIHYVTDPETLFGSETEYLLDVLLEEPDSNEDDTEEKWRLLVLEDTGELLAADAKEQTGQGLSRLLNLVDGIIGQGLRILVLVTTNEPLRRLHPAVARPGRCAMKLEFVPFPPEEAARWLAKHDAVEGRTPAGTLAHLFAHAEGEEAEPERRLGFVR